MKKIELYTTSDFNTSAILYCYFTPVKILEDVNQRITFYFNSSEESFAKIIDDYFTGRLMINAKSFISAQRAVRDVIFQRKRDRQVRV